MIIPDKALDAAADVLALQILGRPRKELNAETDHAITSDAQSILSTAYQIIAEQVWDQAIVAGMFMSPDYVVPPNPYREEA